MHTFIHTEILGWALSTSVDIILFEIVLQILLEAQYSVTNGNIHVNSEVIDPYYVQVHYIAEIIH